MRPLETINSRNTIHFQVVLYLETKCIKDVKLWLTTCINQIQIKFYQRPHQNLLTVQPNFKVSSGKITHAFSHWREPILMQFNWNWSLKQTNVLSSNFWLFTNLKVSVTILTVFWDFHLTKIWKRRSSIICGHLRIMELLIELWSVSVSHLRKWERPHMLSSVVTIQHKSLEEPRD